MLQIVGKRIKMQGFIVGDYYDMLPEFMENMSKYVIEGKVKTTEHVTQGIENAGAAFVEMMKGGNVGKAVVRVCEKDPFPV